jgi:hypothetical protein
LIFNGREYLEPIKRSGRRLFLWLIGEPILWTFTIGETSRLRNSTGWKIIREVHHAAARAERILVAAEPIQSAPPEPLDPPSPTGSPHPSG